MGVKKSITAFVSHPVVILIALFLIQFGFYQYMFIAPEKSAPAGTVYNRIYGYDDVYVSWMRQSALGAWTVRDQRTTATIPGVFIYPLFILLGKVAGLLRVDSEVVYFLSKIVGAQLAFVAVYFLIKEFFPRGWQAVAVLVILGTEMGWRGAEAAIFGLGMVLRHFGTPHHTIGEALGIVFLILYSRNLYAWRRQRLVWLFVIGSTATMLLLPYMVQLVITLAVVFGFLSLYRKTWRSFFLTTVVAFMAVAIPALFYRYEFSLGAPWNNSVGTEKYWYPSNEIIDRYIRSLIFYVPFFLMAIGFLPGVWKRLSRTLQDISILALVGTVAPFAFLAMLPFLPLPLANFRFIDAYIPIYPGLLAAMGLLAAWLVLARNIYGRWLIISFTAIVFVVSGYATYRYTQQTVAVRSVPWTNIFVNERVWEGVQFFNRVPAGSGVLALEHFGDVIADHAPVRVYVGRNPVYADYFERVRLATQFYSGTLTEEAAYVFLRSHDISYVFYGPMERRETTSTTLYPALLSPVFQNEQATVYKVIAPVK